MVAPIDLADLDRERYEDIERILVEWMGTALANLPIVSVSTELPAGEELADLLAGGDKVVVVIEAFGGADRGPAMDVANVDVDVYGDADDDGNPQRGLVSDVAAWIRAAMLNHLPGYYDGVRVTVSDVRTISRPSARPYDDASTIRRFGAAYQIWAATRG